MQLEKRKINVKRLIEKGHIHTLKEIFEYHPITPIIDFLRSSHQRVTKLFNQVGLFKVQEIQSLGEFFDVDIKLMLGLVYNQLAEEKKNPTSTTSKSAKRKVVTKPKTNRS